MITAYQVGLIPAGNWEQIPLYEKIHVALLGLLKPFSLYSAYDFYASDKAKAKAKAEDFRQTFSRNAHVHFVGVWYIFIMLLSDAHGLRILIALFDRDTVSSVGIVRGKNLPYTETSDHICLFRHALALDECRVKFLPEYIKKQPEPIANLPPRVKEVWFAGSHSDVCVFLFEN